MESARLQALCVALDEEIVLMRDLVEASQREQAHVLAFEAHELPACVEQKLALTRRLEAHEQVCRSAILDAASALGLTPAADLTVTSLAMRVPEPARTSLLDRAGSLRSLAGALRELQAMTALMSARGADVLRAWLSSLTGGDARGLTPADTYTSHGRKRPDPITKRDLLTSV
ncbi:MAG: flagellar export chaperone FlgN [Deltaproteobacteria bacterium]|nr:flagellar export chaperone FlgN [Deltaproteobacteria bacterium]MCB9787808.1 flagellar export chaperone FlgN [Deltaproteobacteria bacterium]